MIILLIFKQKKEVKALPHPPQREGLCSGLAAAVPASEREPLTCCGQATGYHPGPVQSGAGARAQPSPNPWGSSPGY